MDNSGKEISDENFDEEYEIEEEIFEEEDAFSEEEAFLDDDSEFEDDEWGEDTFEADAAGTTEAKPKKKISSNTIIIIVAVVVGSGFMLMQLSKPKEGVMPKEPPFQSAIVPAGQVNNPVTTSAQKFQDSDESNKSDQQVGFLNDPSLLDSMDESKVDNNAEPMIDGDSLPPMPDPLSDMPVTPELPAPLTPMPEMGEPVAPMDMAEETIEQEIEEPQNDASEFLKNQLAQREEETSMPNAVEQEEEIEVISPTPQNVMDTQEYAQLNNELKALRAKLEDVQGNAKRKEADLNATIDRLKNNLQGQEAKNQALQEQLKMAQTATKPDKTSAPKDMSASKPVKQAVKTPVITPSPKKQVATVKWELRAARPGQVWVSKPGEKEMRSLVVGDSLPGVGTIRSITYDNGQWIVKGTQGALKQ